MHEPLAVAPLVSRDDGTPYSPRHDNIYHSVAGALAQARHVFLNGNGFPERWREKRRLIVLEMGFGMGINFLATWAAWRDDPRRVKAIEFVSIEKHPFSAGDLRRAHAAIIDDQSISPLAGALALTFAFGDATTLLPHLSERGLSADAIYLDGFAPAKNSDMWTPALFATLAGMTSDDATFATYTSAGDVKRALLQNGFEYRKVAGFGGKRAMLVGKRSRSQTVNAS
ncbi:tRNA (5-methylaminomethyl-2-thiouridine)(34)-methyltransferase MnmD [Caballeronia insecticola]|uniref:tRNA 5-methylaminomethyl-2-thiouridine biosynthesis bifunctional protein MnmC n=1 Tax=Caballeronia insecticola TaxID=758793 RepID=R4X3C5_9BURK|nr:tRNA (5-methylaminomethyl-2-thiouridine)(34)-methyltransferase MnmD [Caballeronia insecticola]BAN27316.1 tRNA 5-methylaminomethyl-2-thiouridine biosynthesis bifunctional protein MnmC [Caballeronia insecticola]